MLGSLGTLLRHKGVLAVLGVMVATGGFVVGSQYAFNADTPVWNVGDTWHYTGTFSVHMDMPAHGDMAAEGMDMDDMDMDEEEQFEFFMQVLDDRQEIGGIPVYILAGSEDGVDFSDELAVTKTDLNPLIPDVGDAWDCAVDPADYEGIEPGSDPASVAPPDLAECQMGFTEFKLFDFPLYPGKSWRITPEFMGDLGNFTARVGDRDVISTPAGNLVAYKISVSMADIKDEELKAMLEEMEIDWGLAYWYSPDIKWIGRVHFWAEGKDPDSGMQGRMELLIEAVDFQNLPVKDGVPIAPEVGTIIDAGSVAIEMSESVVNAADEPTVAFKALGVGLPEDVTYVWHIGDAKAKGASVEIPITEPGVYDVELKAMSDGEKVASASDVLVANYATTIDFGLNKIRDRYAFELPMEQFPDVLQLMYSVGEAGVPLLPHDAEDDLTLYDANENEVATGTAIMVDDFSGFEPGTWIGEVDASFEECLVSCTGTIVVEMLYDGSEPTMDMHHDEGHGARASNPWAGLFPALAGESAAADHALGAFGLRV